VPMSRSSLELIKGTYYEKGLKEILCAYLRGNPLLFRRLSADQEIALGWGADDAAYEAALTAADFEEALCLSVQSSLPELLTSTGCVYAGNQGKEQAYKLTTSSGFAMGFVLSTPLVQDETTRGQIAAILARAIRQRLDAKMGLAHHDVVLVSLTAPCAILARAITEYLNPFCKAYVLDLGHVSSVDEQRLVRGKDWQMPAFVVTDVMRTRATVRETLKALTDRSMKPLGVVGLLQLSESSSRYSPMEWEALDPDDPDGPAVYFMGTYPLPQWVSEETA